MKASAAMSDDQEREKPEVFRRNFPPGAQPAGNRNGQNLNRQNLNRNDQDGTTQLLRWGSTITAFGLVAIGLLMSVLGGVGVEGAHSNSGWLALITGAMCLPFGLMLTVLGIAKWLRNRNLNRRSDR